MTPETEEPQPVNAPARPTLRPLTDDDYRAASEAFESAPDFYRLKVALDAIHARLAADCQPAPQPIDPADLKPGDEFVCTYRYRVDSLGDWDPSEKHGQAIEYHLLGHSDPDAHLVETIARATNDVLLSRDPSRDRLPRAVLDALRAKYVIERKAADQ